MDGDRAQSARPFHDGSPITASDVAFTFHKFMTEGVPQFRLFYKGTP
jgi:microcin C transport system substrate-binding protein